MKKYLLLTSLFMANLALAESTIPMEAQNSLHVTIYNNDRALIKDERQVNLDQGINEIAFAGVSASMMPETALVTGKGIRTQEQNFNFDLLSQHALLEKSVGQTVHTEYISPATGAITSGEATLLSYNNGEPVLKIGNKIETKYPGRIIFDKIPSNLRSRPTLTIKLNSEQKGAEPIQLDYLTTGLSWNADYVARLNSTEDMMDLNGFVTLTNYSGTDYKNAKLQLVAGNVNMVRAEMANYSVRRARKGETSMALADSVNIEAEGLSDFYLYTVPQKTDILSNQKKQVALLSGSGIKSYKTYEIDNVFWVYQDQIKDVKPQIYLTFKNSKENQLGIPLPKGTVRLYKQDVNGGTQFVGEDRIEHTADTETVRLKMGEAFNLKGEMRRTSFDKLSDRLRQGTFEIILRNGGETDAIIDIKQNFPDGFKLLSQSIVGEQKTSNQMLWKVTVPAKGETLLTYKVHWKE